MEQIYKKARAKINLTLNIIGTRQDGYHNLESIFQKISLYDEIYISKIKDYDDIKIISNIKELENKENIIFKAYKLLKKEFKQINGIEVKLIKNIPRQAGLGGGSTDCAAFLKAMNELFELNMTVKQIEQFGIKLGADVPAVTHDNPVFVKGIGEVKEEIKTNLQFFVIVIKPEFSCDTKDMYKKLDMKGEIIQENKTEIVKAAIENSNIDEVSKNLYNIFENVVTGIDIIKKDIIDSGAISSLMTGSGSAVYGIFKNKDEAKIAYKNLKEKYEIYFAISYIKRGKETIQK